jgi:hypothetical protein
MCQAEDVLVSCYYLNKKLEFFGIPSAQVSDAQYDSHGFQLLLWVSRAEAGALVSSFVILCVCFCGLVLSCRLT